MGFGILGFIKSLAPLSLYMLGVLLLLAALLGKVRWTLLFVIFLLPLRNVVERMHNFPAGNKFLTILILAMVVGWIVSNMVQRVKSVEKSSLNMILAILVLYTFFSLQVGNAYLGINSFFNVSDSRLQDWKNFSLFPLLFFLTLNNIHEEKWVWRTFMVMCAAMVLMDYYMVSQIKWFSSLASRDKISGTFQFLGPNEVGAFYNQYSIVLLGVFFFLKKRVHKVLLFLLILLNMYCMVFTYSRAAYMGLGFGLFLLFLLKKKQYLIPLILILIFWQVVLPEKAVERIKGTTNEYGQLEASAERRITVWSESMSLFSQNPVLGIGYGVFRYLGFDLGDTHNIYLKIMVEQGLVGLMIFAIILLCCFREGITLFHRGRDDLSKGLGLGFTVSVFVLMVNNIFGNRWTYLELSAYFWIYAGLVSRLNAISRESVVMAKNQVNPDNQKNKIGSKDSRKGTRKL